MHLPTEQTKPDYWVIVPTYNPGQECWLQWIAALKTQVPPPKQVFVVDSSSQDGTPSISKSEGFQVFTVNPAQFNHGGTRQWALEQAIASSTAQPEFVVYLTQDALLDGPQAIDNLLTPLQDPQIAAAFGRQLAKPNAPWMESHARQFNYPPQSRTVQAKDKSRLGLKVCFFSDAFAAYRLKALQAQGGFPKRVPLGEDTYVAGKLLLSGHSLRYEAQAGVYHSHHYNAIQDFQRMFDTGVFHAQNPWLRDEFGTAEGEGLRLARSQFEFLKQIKDTHWVLGLFQMVTRNLLKLTGYRLGLHHHLLPMRLKLAFAMHKPYWTESAQHSQA